MRSETTWRTVFDLAEAGYQNWGWGLAGVVVVLLSLGLRLLGKQAMKGRHPVLSDTLPKAIVVIGTLFGLITFLPSYLPYRSLRAAVDAGEAQVVQGQVHEFREARPATDEPESFLVGGQRFRYYDYELSPGFHTTARRGGPMREGLLVRIEHVNGVIVRLEVAE